MIDVAQQSELNSKNSEFWSELCGSGIAQVLGITDASTESLRKFDDWYFAYYFYLFRYIPFMEVKGKRVLEIGLGYGSVSQKLAEWGADYVGLDISPDPVKMVKARLAQSNLPGEAQLGSCLAAPFEDDQFDHVVAIGCLHHTGDLQKAIEECRRVLKPGGTLILMVYYAYSYRRFMSSRATTLRYMFRELFGYRGVIGSSAEAERAAYDSGSDGTGAPHTDWVSSRSLRYFCRHFKDYADFPENIGQEPPFSDRTRAQLVLTPWSRWFGLDLYAVATK